MFILFICILTTGYSEGNSGASDIADVRKRTKDPPMQDKMYWCKTEKLTTTHFGFREMERLCIFGLWKMEWFHVLELQEIELLRFLGYDYYEKYLVFAPFSPLSLNVIENPPYAFDQWIPLYEIWKIVFGDWIPLMSQGHTYGFWNIFLAISNLQIFSSFICSVG